MDVDKVVDKLGMPIDEKIKPLVDALNNKLGIKTEASCQGHENWGERFPWVDIDSNQNLSKLSRVLAVWNGTSNIKWVLYPYATWWRLRPLNLTDLESMQKNAVDLGLFIKKFKFFD
jgi:hypothetical protein